MLIWIISVAKISNMVFTKITEQWQNWKFNIWSNISFAWKITDENNFPLYTHKITNSKWEYVFLRSSVINLNKYLWDIEINWEIKDIRKDRPIIEITSIKFPEQWLIIKNNTYFFVKDMLYLDFSNQSLLSAKKEWKEIQIFYEDQKLSSIERFLCSRVLRQKDCSYLIEDYWNSQKENFDSYRWYTYYKHWTGLRTVFDWMMFWYIFKDIEEENMLNLSNIIRIVDKDFVISNKRDQIEEACKKKDGTIEQISINSIQYEDDNKINIIIDIWKDENFCKINFDVRNERDILKTEIVKK